MLQQKNYPESAQITINFLVRSPDLEILEAICTGNILGFGQKQGETYQHRPPIRTFRGCGRDRCDRICCYIREILPFLFNPYKADFRYYR
jgi:hypothetical protein